MNTNPIHTQLLDVAQALVQTRGFNAMSFRDLADAVGIKTASIHYYFPTKEDLGLALLARYRSAFKGALTIIDAQTDEPKTKIKKCVDLFIATVRSDKICLVGMFATDFITISDSMQSEVKQFYTENETWLATVCKQGRDLGMFSFIGSPKNKAETIFATLEGALIAARLFKNEERLQSAGEWVLAALSK